MVEVGNRRQSIHGMIHKASRSTYNLYVTRKHASTLEEHELTIKFDNSYIFTYNYTFNFHLISPVMVLE